MFLMDSLTTGRLLQEEKKIFYIDKTGKTVI